jgi:hypothetical protein
VKNEAKLKSYVFLKDEVIMYKQ